MQFYLLWLASIVEVEEKAIKFSFPAPEPLGTHGPFMTMKNVCFAYEKDKLIISNVNMRVEQDSRIAILGRNGSGKSTLLSLLVGQLDPTRGELFRSHKLRVGYFTQHHINSLNLEVSALERILKRR